VRPQSGDRPTDRPTDGIRDDAPEPRAGRRPTPEDDAGHRRRPDRESRDERDRQDREDRGNRDDWDEDDRDVRSRRDERDSGDDWDGDDRLPARTDDERRGLADTARQVGAGGARAGRAGFLGLQALLRAIRSFTHARGAGPSGLARVLELHLVASIADTFVVTALATTIFFAVPSGQARGRVATSLLITMVPFIVLAPLIGPLLDRLRRGRRYAMATTMIVRAFLAWVMADGISHASTSQGQLRLYPAAFGFLVCQKAYIVTRAAAVPRVLPPEINLVAANSRISMAGVLAMAVAGPLGAGLNSLSPSFTMRVAFIVFTLATALALVLPARVDTTEGEVGARIVRVRPVSGDRYRDHEDTGRGSRPGRTGQAIGRSVVLTLRANAALRAFTGFLTLFLAFRLRTHPLGGLKDTTAVVLVVVLAAVGGGVGTALGGLLRRLRPHRLAVVLVLLTALASGWAAWEYGLLPVMTVALIAGLTQALGKLCLDALIQSEVPEHVRTSAFARSETVLQLAWVAGGFAGLWLPLSGAWGLGLASVATLGGAVASSGLWVLNRERPSAAAARGSTGGSGAGGRTGSAGSGARTRPADPAGRIGPGSGSRSHRTGRTAADEPDEPR